MSQPRVYCSLVSGEIVILALKDRLVSQRQPEMLHKPLPPLHSCNSSAALLRSESRLQSLNRKGGRGERKKNVYICFTLSLFLIPSFPTPPVAAPSQPHLPVPLINHSSPSRCKQQRRAASHPGAAAEPVPTNPLELRGLRKGVTHRVIRTCQGI